MHWTGNFDWWLIILSYDEALKLDPKDKEAWNSKGIAFYN